MKPIKTLTWNIEELAAALSVDSQSVREYFTDGRRVAFLIEHRIARRKSSEMGTLGENKTSTLQTKNLNHFP